MDPTPPVPAAEPLTATSPQQDMADIHYLLHLEALKHYTDDLRHVQHQVQEQARLWADTKWDYLDTYTRYSRLLKEVGICQTVPKIDDTAVTDTRRQISDLHSTIAQDQRLLPLNVPALNEHTHQLLMRHQPRLNLKLEQQDFAQNHENLKALASSLDKMEAAIEVTVTQAMKQMVLELRH